MKCNHCKSTWNTTVRTVICPFCGESIQNEDEIKINSVTDALRKIIEERTLEIFNSPKVVTSLVADYVPGFQREKKLLRIACSNGALKYIIAIANEINYERRELYIQKLNRILIDDAFLSDDNAALILGILLDAIKPVQASSQLSNKVDILKEYAPIQGVKKQSGLTFDSDSNNFDDESSFAELFEEYIQNLCAENVVTGMLVNIETGVVCLEGAVTDIGYLPIKEIQDRDLSVGDDVKAVVIGVNENDGSFQLSCDQFDKMFRKMKYSES